MSSAGHLIRHAVAAARGRRVPFALCFHGIGDAPAGADPHGLLVTRAAFAAHLDLLARLGYRLVDVVELWETLARGRGAADGLGAITFDDGLADTLRIAGEELERRGGRATAFLAPGLFGADHPDLPGHRIVRAEEVAGLSPALLVGAHSHSHADLPSLPVDAQRHELHASRAELEALTGREVATMAYPYGRFDATTMRLAGEAGYRVACAVEGSGPWHALALPREPVFPSTSAVRMRLKVGGLYGPAMALRARMRRPAGGA